MYNQKFEELKTEIENFLKGISPYSKEEIFQNIKDNNFLGSISNAEKDFLINMLPIDTEWIDDDGSSSLKDIEKRASGINLENIEFGIVDPDDYDEFDLIQPDKKERKTGFSNLTTEKDAFADIESDDLDFLIDLESDSEEDDDDKPNNSGFLGLFQK